MNPKTEGKMIFVLFAVALFVFLAMVLYIFIWDLDRENAREAVSEAIERMEQVNEVSDTRALLRVCEATIPRRIQCKLDDDPVTYRGHHIPASKIAIEYYRVWKEGEKNNPDITVVGRIERRSHFQIIGHF